MAQINCYINFDGNCREAFEFYKSVFGGEFSHISTFGEMPPQEGMPAISEDFAKLVMHVSLPISKETVLMGSDVGGEWASNYKAGTNVQLSVGTSSKEEADAIFNGLSKGGQITMPIADTFWGSYFGMLVDPFGIIWMVSYDSPRD